MPQSLSAVFVHGIYSTKDRHPFLDDPGLRAEMHSMLGGISNQLGCPSVRVGGVEDHVHVVSLLGRGVTQSDWVKELKRQSSLWAKDRHGSLRDFAWQPGFGVFSVDPTRLDQVSAYIENQAEHHQVRTFKEEYLAILREYKCEFDERYVWD